MANIKRRKYNAIPRGDDKKAVAALTKIAETLTGATGDKLEKALTMRDLEGLNLVNIQRGINGQGNQFTNIVKAEVVTEANFPAKPTNFTVAGAYSTLLLAWDTPSYKGHSTTEIYRSELDVLGEAKFIASTISSLYGDPVGTNSSYYYWIRHVNINGDKGPYNDTSGVFAQTAPDVEYLLEQLTEQIDTSELALSLRQEIEWISKPGGLRATLFDTNGVIETLFDTDGVIETLFDTDGVIETLNRPNTGLVDASITAAKDIKTLGIDTALIRNVTQASSNELLNLGSAVHHFRKSYEERLASGERLIDATVYIDPDNGQIINRAFSYTDDSFTQAGLIIDGVDGRVSAAVERVTELEDKATFATGEIEVLAGQVNLRATYSEVQGQIATSLAALVPAYSFQFNSDNEGFTGVTHNAGGWIISTAASPAVSPDISYDIAENPAFRMLVRLHVGGTWNGSITAGSETIPVFAPSVEDSWEILSVRASGTGTITSLTFDLGDVDIDYIEIAKQQAGDLALEGLTARVTEAETSLNAIDGTYITSVITAWYDSGEIITSDVNTLIDSFNTTYSISATLEEINQDGTVSKANSAQSWVNGADANIRDVVLAYNSEKGITNVSLDLDGINGRITQQVFSVSGLSKDIYSTKQAALEQEYYMHLLRTGSDTGEAKLALANSELRAFVNDSGDAVAQQITTLTAVNNGNIANIDRLDSAIVGESETRLESINRLTGNYDDVDARVDNVITLNLSEDSAIIQRFVNVEADVDGANGKIQDVINLNVLPTSVLAQKFTLIEGQINDPNTGNTASSGRIDDVINLDISPSTVLAQRFTTIDAKISDPVTGLAASSGRIDDVLSLNVDSDSVLLQKFTTIEGQINNVGTGLTASNGRIDDVINLDLLADSAILSRFTTIEADVTDKNSASNGRIDDVISLNLSPASALISKFTVIEGQINNLDTGIAASSGRIDDVINLNLSSSSAILSRFTTIEAQVTGNTDDVNSSNGRINDVISLTLDPSSAIAQKFTSIETSVTNANSSSQSLFNDVINFDLSPTSVIAQKFTTIESSVNDVQSGLTASYAILDDIVNLDVSPTSALLERFTSLESTVYDGNEPAWSAGITNLESALAYDNGAIAIAATDVYVTDNEGNQQGIQQFAEVKAQEAVEGSDVTALWSVKATIGELTAGFGLYNNGVTSQFAVSADSFEVINPVAGTGLVPFAVRTSDKHYNSDNVRVAGTGSTGYVYSIPSGVYMTTLFAMDGYFTNIVAGTINADYVNALNIDVAGKLRATGVDFNGGTFVVDTDGAVIAKNITIKDSLGNTILDANEVNGTYIKNLSVDTLSIAGNAVTAVVSAFTASASGATTLQTVNINTVGGSVEIVLQAYIGIVASGGGSQFVYFNLYRNATLLKTIAVKAQSDRSVYDTSILIHVDTPPAGLHMYNLTRTGHAANVTNRYLSAREFKK
jgi:hypothetical protein